MNGWIDAPAPHPAPPAVLIAVEATAPAAPLTVAHGRVIEQPLRKLASFVATDGPRAALRKARAKRAEAGFTGDLHLVAALGRDASASEDGPLLLALAPRAPACAELIAVHPDLVRPAPNGFGEPELAELAAALGSRATELRPVVGQSYLHSGMNPPSELLAALDRALAEEPSAGPRAPVLRPERSAHPADPVLPLRAAAPGDAPPLAILGAGDYVRMEIAPALTGVPLRRDVLCDREPQIAARAAAELGFARATTDAAAAIDLLDRRGVVIIATAHDSHAALAAHALDAGHRVLLEKPAVVDRADLDLLMSAAERHPGELEVGFNRRHNPLVRRARELVRAEREPATIVATIREVDIEDDHWYLWPNQGTRVAGNLCHWIEVVLELLGPDAVATTVAVSPRASSDPTGIDAERAYSIAFEDGSSATLVPTGRGDSTRGVQEQIEIRRGPLTVLLDDLWRLRGSRAGRPIRGRTLWRDKGHTGMYREQLGRFASGAPAAFPAEHLRRVCEVQLALSELVLEGRSEGEVERSSRTHGQSNSIPSGTQKKSPR